MRSAKALHGVLSKSRGTAGLESHSDSTSRLGHPRPLHSTRLALPQDEMGRRRGGGGTTAGDHPEGDGVTARKPRGVRDLPGPGFASNLVEFFWKDGFSRIHDIQLQQARRFGAMWGTSFGPQFVVSLASPGLVAHVLRSEGPAPQRANMASWNEYRALRGRANGLISAEGEEWLRMRAVLRQPLMRARSVWRHSEQINAIVEDVVSRVRCDRDERDGTVRNVNGLLFKFAMEGMASVLFERRLGCLAPEVPADTRDYIAALQLMFSMFKTTMYAGAIPRWLRPVLPGPWEDFCRSWDGLFRFSEMHVDARVRELEEERSTGGAVREAGFLTEQLTSGALSRQELYANVTEMLLAGVDTTSFTLSWCLDLLARHPLTQEAVLREVRERGPSGGRALSAEHVAEMPLLRGVLKETLRLYPVLPGNGRVTQMDMVLGGHHIPKGTQLAMCHYSTSHDLATFPQPESFCPERWLRDGASRGGPAVPHGDGSGDGEEEGEEEEGAHRCPESAHGSRDSQGFASIPFGYGVRSCVGRRVAELEIHLALARLLLEFRVEALPGAPRVPAKTHGLLGPGGCLDLRFVDRHS